MKAQVKQVKRDTYLVSFVVILIVEICIALFAHGNFIRSYIGDVLVIILLCCLVRFVSPNKPKLLALYVFLFSAIVELSQLVSLADKLGLESGILRIMMGTTFDWADIICYFVGSVLFYVAEKLCQLRTCCKKESK